MDPMVVETVRAERPPVAAADGETVARRTSPWRRWLCRRLLQSAGDPPVCLVLDDGSEIRADADERMGSPGEEIRILVHDGCPLLALAADPIFQFPHQFSNGTIEVEGDLVELLGLINGARPPGRLLGLIGRLVSRPWRIQKGTSLWRARQNISHHYDIGNDFYRLWLDPRMVYTCAYYESPELTLEEAQVAKMDHVCRKLEIEPGDTVIEAGCGWGALARHIASVYGARVRAFNISHEQIAWARQRAHEEGLSDRVEFIEDDWRNIDGRCDKFVSVGMLEHVGRRNYSELGTLIDRVLEPEGRALIHSIGRNQPRHFDDWTEQRIFPGAYPPSPAEMTRIFEPHRFSILDVENLRLHYARTCRDWLERFDDSAEAVREMFDETFVRTWRMYLAASVNAFQVGGLQLFQVLLARERDNSVPWTRGHLYRHIDKSPAPGS